MTGGIRADELYGAPEGGDLLGASRRILVPRGEPDPTPYEVGFLARSLYIENPSGVWYRVAGVAVAPWTWGQVVRLDVPMQQLEVEQVTPPLLTSEDHGDELLIVAYEQALEPMPGRTLYPPPRAVERESLGLQATEAHTTYALGLAGTGHRVVPTDVQFVAWATTFLRALVICTWDYELAPGGAWATFARQAISPERPQASPVDVGWLAAVIGEDCDIRAGVEVEDGGGAMGVAATLIYYRALP